VIREHHIRVVRTARYCVLGEAGPHVREAWIACHGYAQLARYFARSLTPLDDGSRIIIVPEALNRFYHGRAMDDPAHASRVAATWMTREDRAHEIADYVAYLDALAHHALAPLQHGVRTIALGFSQGAATASRWAARGAARLDALVLWGAGPAHDLDLGPGTFRGARLLLSAGKTDGYLDAKRVAAERRRLHDAGVQHEVVEYDGGHAIDAAALAAVAERVRA
jgi:predicted esterase